MTNQGDTIWTLTEDEDNEQQVWVHATKQGATQHMQDLMDDQTKQIPGSRIEYVEVWSSWCLYLPDDEDEAVTWQILEGRVFA